MSAAAIGAQAAAYRLPRAELCMRLRRLQRELSWRGLDLVQPFSLAWLQPTSQLPTAGLAVLVGNTRAIWPPFIAALAGREGLERPRKREGEGTSALRERLWSDRHPLNCYVRHSVVEAAQSAGLVLDEAVFDWERREGRCLPLQRIAHVTGMAHLLQQAHLAIHPLVGPWLALRAVIVIGNATAEDAGLAADGPPEVREGGRREKEREDDEEPFLPFEERNRVGKEESRRASV